tara:strand:+ start:24 stop:884 length:861 start_codon:yes stop_codon:yes gene_type:complete
MNNQSVRKKYYSNDIIDEATGYLSTITDSPKLESEILLADILKKDRLDFYKRNISIDHLSYKKYQSLLSERQKGKPLAYLTGKKEFWSLSLEVNEAVLIPRPETELLVEKCQSFIKKINNPNVLELGTGSGAISIALAKESPLIRFTAIDISSKALEIAKKNAVDNHVNNILFKTSNWFSEINEEFNIIVSNPPYVDKDKLTKNELENLYFEPDIALYSRDSGQSAINHIIRKSQGYLRENGLLLLEHAYNQKDFCQNELELNGYVDIKTYDDLNHLPRVTIGKKI